MVIKEKYSLSFQKINWDSRIRYSCFSANNSINGSPQLANLLDVLSDREPDGLLEEVNLALIGGDYEPDMSSVDTIRITPPNAIINDSYTISLIELKQLLEEWIEFVKQ